MTPFFRIAIFVAALMPAGPLAAVAQDPYLSPEDRSCVSGFALCTSAPCIPDPGDPTNTAICTCEVTNGPNYAAQTACEDRDPATIDVDGKPVTLTVSTYSFVQAATKPVMTCADGALWTDCLDAPCTVDPKDPLRAICACDIVTSGDFVTYGGSCNTNTCANAVWSAATVKAFQEGSANLRAFMQLAAVPAQYCPGQAIAPLGQ